MGSAEHGHSSSNMVLGVVICILSLLCGSLNLALAGVLGEMKMSVYDTVAYMSVPATVFLLPFAMFLNKPLPGQWPKVFDTPDATDWQILQQASRPYNIVQFSIVHTLSPSATAFGGNFNKAALVLLTLTLPFLQVHALPGSPYIEVIWFAVIGNVLAFSAYSYLQILEKEKAKTAALPEEKVGFTSEAEEDWDSDSTEASAILVLSGEAPPAANKEAKEAPASHAPEQAEVTEIASGGVPPVGVAAEALVDA
eukprot:g25692.t1